MDSRMGIESTTYQKIVVTAARCEAVTLEQTARKISKERNRAEGNQYTGQDGPSANLQKAHWDEDVAEQVGVSARTIRKGTDVLKIAYPDEYLTGEEQSEKYDVSEAVPRSKHGVVCGHSRSTCSRWERRSPTHPAPRAAHRTPLPVSPLGCSIDRRRSIEHLHFSTLSSPDSLYPANTRVGARSRVEICCLPSRRHAIFFGFSVWVYL
jgi:hypothetical protein